MGHVIRINGGQQEIITDEWDVLQLIGDYMGYEMENAVREMIQEIKERYEDEYSDSEDAVREAEAAEKKYKDKIQRIENEYKKLVPLIADKEIDRRRLSEVVGRIGVVLHTAPF